LRNCFYNKLYYSKRPVLSTKKQLLHKTKGTRYKRAKNFSGRYFSSFNDTVYAEIQGKRGRLKGFAAKGGGDEAALPVGCVSGGNRFACKGEFISADADGFGNGEVISDVVEG